MKYKLTESDIRELRYACRPGIILAVLLSLMGNLVILGVVFANHYSYRDPIIQFMVVASIVIPVIICYLMNRKFMSDIRSGEKVVERETIRLKERKSDFEAGSGVVGKLGKSMNQFERYDLIIDNRRVRVEKELYEESEEGGEVDMFYAPVSRYLLQIQIHKQWQTISQ